MEQSEGVTPGGQVAKETNKLVEKIGKGRVRAIAYLGLAASMLLGISGKPNTGVGLGIEVPNPMTGESVSVGVVATSSEYQYPMGTPNIPGKDYKDIQAYQVSIGGAKLAVYTATLEGDDGSVVKTIGIYPGFETKLGRK